MIELTFGLYKNTLMHKVNHIYTENIHPSHGSARVIESKNSTEAYVPVRNTGIRRERHM